MGIINILIPSQIDQSMVLCMDDSSQDAIHELGCIDCKFGILPAIATIKTQMNDKNRNYFDFNHFLSKLRQFMILLESYSGVNYDKQESEICNVTAPDFLLFESSVKFKNLPKNFFKKIYDYLTEHYFESYRPGGIGHKCHKIVKKKNTLPSKPFVTCEIQSALNLPYSLFSGPIQIRNKPISNVESFLKRIELTNKFGIEFNEKNHGIQYSHDKKFDTELRERLKCIKIFPLVGKVRDFPNQDILYIMCYYKTDKKLELHVINKYLDNMLPKTIQHDTDFRKLIKQCAESCKPSSHQCFISKLLARKINSHNVCAVYTVLFSREMKRSKQNNFPIKQMYNYVKKELHDWEVYMNRMDNYQFSI